MVDVILTLCVCVCVVAAGRGLLAAVPGSTSAPAGAGDAPDADGRDEPGPTLQGGVRPQRGAAPGLLGRRRLAAGVDRRPRTLRQVLLNGVSPQIIAKKKLGIIHF